MKFITIPLAEFAAIDEPLDRAGWDTFYRKHGVEPSKVVRSYPNAEQTGYVHEVEE